MTVKKHTMFLYIAAICFTASSSAFIKGLPVIGQVINAVECVIFIYCFLMLIKSRKVNTYTWLVILFYVLLGVSTVLGTKEYFTYIVYAIQGIGATVFINYEFNRYPVETAKVLRNVLMCFILINLFMCILFPGGFYGTGNTAMFFLGYRIAFTPFIIAQVFFSLLYDYASKASDKISIFSIASVVVGFMSVLIKNVSTGIVTLAAVLGLVAICKHRKKQFNLYYFYIIYAVIFVGIVIYNIQYHIPFISYFLVDVLGKSLTFDHRTTIWLATIKEFLEKPILGYGLTGGGGVLVKFEYRVATLSAHNQILNLLWEGGVVAFSVFAAMGLQIGRALKRAHNNNISYLACCFIIGFFVMMFTEVQMTKALIFLLFAAAANIQKVIDDKEERLEVFRRYALRTHNNT
ncbi:MAG: O-antigen ligase family protein [Acutalibacteraceae bacterium]